MTYIHNITNKANASLRFIKRNVKTNSIKTKELAYKTYVRPKVEYCSVVWDPWQKQHCQNFTEKSNSYSSTL